MDENKVKSLINNIWDCYNEWNREGYVTDEFLQFADKVEELTNYLSEILLTNK